MSSFDAPEELATPEHAQRVRDEIERVLANVAIVTPKVKNVSPYKGANWQGMSWTWHESGIVHPDDRNVLVLATVGPNEKTRSRYAVEMTLPSGLLLASYVDRPVISPQRPSPDEENFDISELPVGTTVPSAEIERRNNRIFERQMGLHRTKANEAENLLLQLSQIPPAPADGSGT